MLATQDVLERFGQTKRVEFVWDGEVLALELDTETGPRAFVHQPGSFEPVLQQQNGETYLSVNDHLGMPKELIDGQGHVAWAGEQTTASWSGPYATGGGRQTVVPGGRKSVAYV